MFTAADVDDGEPLKQGSFLNNIKGKLCADKGYIGKILILVSRAWEGISFSAH